MASSEKFCLRWNDFDSNMHEAFQEIRNEKDLFDCTLSCGARQIEAHKLVLAASSPFFRTIFKQNPHNHPLLYLKGIKFTNLQSVLNFIYHGEVNIAKEELNSFLAVAEELQVKGLTENTNKQEPKKIHDLIFPESPTIGNTSHESAHIDSIQEELPIVKIEADQPQPQQVQHQSNQTSAQAITEVEEDKYDTAEESYGMGDSFEMNSYEVNEQTDGYDGFEVNPIDTSKGPASYVHRLATCYSCGFCQKEFRDQSNCRRHVREKHFGQDKDSCPLCGKILYKRHIQDHMKRCIPNLQ